MTAQQFESVWDALEDSPADAAGMKARADVLIAVEEVVRSWALARSEAAKRLGLTRPRFDELMRGNIETFSLDDLMRLAVAAGLSVRVETDRPAA